MLVVARGDELLGHEVHAVVQAADHAEVGRAVELEESVLVVVLGKHDDRLCSRPGRNAR